MGNEEEGTRKKNLSFTWFIWMLCCVVMWCDGNERVWWDEVWYEARMGCLWYSYAASCTKELSEPFFFEAIAMKQLSLSLDIITSSGFKFYFLFIRFFSNFFINYFSQFIINVTNYSIICISLVRIIENNYYFLIIH